MKKLKALLSAAIGFGTVLFPLSVKAELSPQSVVDGVYAGIQHIHSYRSTPKLIWNTPQGTAGACGPIQGTHYCTRNHTVYITNRDVRMAYQHGDAALAYIIAHEYAHAMQVAYRFMPRTTTLSELQADCLAGVYLGAIPNMSLDRRDVQEIGSFAYRVGDYAWWSRHHHGTPAQRVRAVVTGLQASLNGRGVAACRAS